MPGGWVTVVGWSRWVYDSTLGAWLFIYTPVSAQEARGSGAVSMLSHGKDAVGDADYERHRPEQTLLYQIVEEHYPALLEQLGQQGKCLPDHVRQEFEAYLKCGRLEHGWSVTD